MWTRISPFITAAKQFVGAPMPGSSLLCPPAETKAGQQSGYRGPGPGGLRPSCPPSPENSELVDAGASPADQRLATIASAKALSLHPLLALGLWSLAKAGAQHEAPSPIWVPQPLAAGAKTPRVHQSASSAGAGGAQSQGSALEVKFFASPWPSSKSPPSPRRIFQV